jgi:hypothetical protein
MTTLTASLTAPPPCGVCGSDKHGHIDFCGDGTHLGCPEALEIPPGFTVVGVVDPVRPVAFSISGSVAPKKEE